MDPYIGKLLDNRYEILEPVGTGGMARVYKARCHRLNRLVAIKILREDLAQDAEFRRRFHDESQAVAMLSHPNIVAVYDVSRSSELEYIVMELIDGINLKQYMQKKGNKLNWREALYFITQITKALGHAHSRGIIHRDIKPHNIMVLRDGSVKVADFGIARVASGGHSTLTQEALGSVHYISPEQARGSHIDERSDLYSAGVVLYEMITGRLPFEGDTPVAVAIQHINSIPLSPREIDPTIPEALEAITMKAMAPNPNNRYSSADEMLADLEEFRKNPDVNFEYHVSDFSPEAELDEDRTQVRPIAPSHRSGTQRASYSAPRETRREREYHPEEEEPARRGPMWPVILAVAGVLLFVGLVFFFLWNSVFSGLLEPPETYSVPKLVGKMYEDVKDDTALLGEHFTVVLGDTVADDSEPGTIIKQDPEDGKKVTGELTEITITISGGQEMIEMIDLTNMDFQTAYNTLVEMGLKPLTPEYEFDDKVEENHVISYTPMKGVPLSPGDEVQMVVSKGPEKKTFVMPSLVDMTLELAQTNIDNCNLSHGRVQEAYDDTVPEGKVISQYPTAGTEVAEGDEVNLIVSKGPDPSTLPPEPTEVTKTIYVPMPGDAEGLVNVRVLVDGEEVLNQALDATMSAQVPVTVTGTGVKTVTYYFDGEYGGSMTVDLTQADGT
ncbi:Stk1 family PASTA domain-containing Ser/Thr kinase [Lawsonibacter sp. LCP25S3_G6]|uniref:Stk1 family PASTA domain-containing Ser/Thr kinase n=1 Tax=unclassified Lawsonibacter TaxID=2617946 RepID=UPI003F9A16E9